MIEKMKKVQVVVRRGDRERLLDKLQDLGVLHVTPINPDLAVADNDVALSLEKIRRAVQVLSVMEPSGEKPEVSALEVSDEVNAVLKAQAEYDTRLTSLHRQLAQQSVWGDVTLADLDALKSAGITPLFYILPSSEISQIKAEFYTPVTVLGKDRVLVAVIDRAGEAEIPEMAEPVAMLKVDNPSIRAEASAIDAGMKENNLRLASLAHLLDQIQQLQMEMESRAEFSVAANGALTEGDLFAIEGWVPADHAENLGPDLDASGISAGIRSFDPTDEDTPPTLITYPKWASPIKGLFDILNTFPGYHEIDLAAFFMIAMPVFAAMLIGDGGYGLIFLGLGIYMYKKMSGRVGPEAIQLIIIIGLATLIWGILSANFFGVSPETMAHATGGDVIDASDEVVWDKFYEADGIWATVGNAMIDVAPLWKEDGEDSRELLIQISFILGSLHLISAHIRKLIGMLPSQQAIAEIGWSLLLAGVLGMIWSMFFVDDGEDGPVSSSLIMAGIAGGLALVVLFGAPDKNPLKRMGVGFASALLPLIGTFGDTMSYIRLMAVGLASYYIAFAFNDLGATIAESGTWGAAAPILIAGHGLNIILCIIAIFAHGVRLNMLEFSNNAGVQWAGYAYAPFSKIKT